jgi:hypothetical protein
MSALVEAPREFIEAVGSWSFPPQANRRLQELMDRNTEGQLAPDEREELAELVELSETMSLFRAQALQLLRRQP